MSGTVASLERGQVILIRVPISSCVLQSCTSGTSLGEELIGLSTLGAGDFILRGLITLKICHMPSYEWAVVTETVNLLKLLQLFKFNDRSPNMA